MAEELKPSSPKQLSSQAQWLFKCQSGNVYRLRKAPLPAMAKFFTITHFEIPSDDKQLSIVATTVQQELKSPERFLQFANGIRELLPDCITEPVVSATQKSSDTTLNIDDMPISDQIEIFTEIMSKSGVGLEALREQEKFRS